MRLTASSRRRPIASMASRLDRGRAEEQLVVVAAGHEVGDRRLAPVDSAPGRCRERHGVRIDARRDPRFLAEVAQVRDQPIGDVDRARREPDKRRAEREPGHGQAEALGKCCVVLRREVREAAAHGAQAQCRVADGSGDVDVVAFARARAGEAGIACDRAEGGQREHRRPLRRHRVAADQRDTEGLLIAGEACGERLHPGIGDVLRQREAERVGRGGGAHGSEVGEVHAEQSAGDGEGSSPSG